MANCTIKESLKTKILAQLYKTGPIPRKSLYSAFTNYNYSNYTIVLKKLIGAGYVREYKDTHRRLRYIEITRQGQAILREILGEEMVQLRRNRISATNEKSRRRRELVAAVVNLCEGNMFITEKKEKVPLKTICSIEHKITSEEQRMFLDTVEQGVFYFVSEIRDAFQEVFDSVEFMNSSRLVGVLFYKGHLSYVYSMNDKLIEWRFIVESRMKQNIQMLLQSSEIICNYTDVSAQQQGKGSCIICGRTLKNIPHLAYGRPWGRKDDPDKTLEILRARQAKTHLNSYNIGKLFNSAAYVATSKQGVQQFRLAAMLTDERKRVLFDAWYAHAQQRGVYAAYSLGAYQGVTEDGERVAVMPYVDLIYLDRYKQQDLPMHLFILEEYTEALCRVMGPLILSLNDLNSWEPLDIIPYDKNGGYIDDDEWEYEEDSSAGDAEDNGQDEDREE